MQNKISVKIKVKEKEYGDVVVDYRTYSDYEYYYKNSVTEKEVALSKVKR